MITIADIMDRDDMMNAFIAGYAYRGPSLAYKTARWAYYFEEYPNWSQRQLNFNFLTSQESQGIQELPKDIKKHIFKFIFPNLNL